MANPAKKSTRMRRESRRSHHSVNFSQPFKCLVCSRMKEAYNICKFCENKKTKDD